MKAIKYLFLIALAAVTAPLNAQTDSTENNKPQFKISLNYNTGLHYFGRTDSLRSSGFFPLAEFWVGNKFYINAAPIFVNNAVQQFEYAGSVATVGYQNVTDKWITGLYFTKPIYKDNSELVQSALKAQTGLNLSYLNKMVNITAGGDLKFSDKVDFGATAGIDHIIRIPNIGGGVVVVDPSFYAYAGSQNFQRSYYKKNNSGFLLFPGNNQLVTEEVSRFNLLAYEASVPLIYAKAKWLFLATPAYIMPQNLVTVPGRPNLSERGKNMFYTTLTAKYSF